MSVGLLLALEQACNASHAAHRALEQDLRIGRYTTHDSYYTWEVWRYKTQDGGLSRVWAPTPTPTPTPTPPEQTPTEAQDG